MQILYVTGPNEVLPLVNSFLPKIMELKNKTRILQQVHWLFILI